MTDKQPDALIVADALTCEASFDIHHLAIKAMKEGAALLRTQHAEIERLNAAIQWEQNRAERIGTHGPGCEKWGSAHYECLLRSVERKDALLRQALTYLEESRTLEPINLDWVKGARRAVAAAITKEISQ